MPTHITREERIALAALLREDHSQADTARAIGKSPSAVSRELARNAGGGGTYHATRADVFARRRRKESKVGARKIENDPVLARSIKQLLCPLVSPEVVAHEVGIAHETIYAWVRRSRPDLNACLPQRGRKRRKYGSKRAQKQGWTKHVRSIAARPETRESWEGDTVKGSTKARLLTNVERRSLYLVADQMPDGTADSVHARTKRHAFEGTMTYDRGSEFALWRMIERDTKLAVYFAQPHHPWQRGKNENTNGRIRRVFPKRFDFSTIRQREVNQVVSLMNHTPRKSLSWQTPCMVYGKCCVSS